MRGNNRLWIALSALLATACLAQLGRVFLLRFEYGDVYAPYSTYRSDPMGMRAFYEALRALPGMEARRQLTPLEVVELPPDAALLAAGAADSPDPKAVIEKLEKFVTGGGRLVIAFNTRATFQTWVDSLDEEAGGRQKRSRAKRDDEDTGGPDAPGGSGGPKDGQPGENVRHPKEHEGAEGEGEDSAEGERKKGKKRRTQEMVNIKERWGFSFKKAKEDDPQEGEKSEAEAKNEAKALWQTVGRVDASAALPEKIAWKSPWYFSRLANHWKTWYAWMKDDQACPVIVERTWGKGSILLCADSYFLSNEAMTVDRHPTLLAAVVGPHRLILADETHLGTQNSASIGALLRKYRLTLFMASLALLALLCVWKNATTLVPRRSEDVSRERLEIQQGKDAFSGLANLVRRGAPPAELAAACFSAWRQDFGRSARYAHLDEASARAALAQPGPAAQYQALYHLIHQPRPVVDPARKEDS